MATLAPVLRQGTAGRTLLVAGSRHELLQQIHNVVHDVAPRWGDEDSATIVITSPLLGPADVEAAFYEIDDEFHLEGIDLRVHQQHGECLRAVFEPSRSRYSRPVRVARGDPRA